MRDAFYQLWFAVRYVHVASVALLAGGAALTTVAVARLKASRDDDGADTAIDIAVAYEWTFWSIVGVTAVTGVSNLGLKGDGLLPPETGWGAALAVKLGAALLILAVSLIRSDLVASASEWRQSRGLTPSVDRRVLTTLYGLTVIALLSVMWIGLGLAHGRY